MTIEIIDKTPTLQEYKYLRSLVKWDLESARITDERVLDSLDRCPACVTAYEGPRIVGMVRLSGDLGMYGYIQDTIVNPTHQGRGIGTKMMERLLHKVDGLNGYLIGVCPSKVSVDFYKKFGFKKKPEDPNGFMYLETKA